jgi:anti-sigma factor ChrR (cupin superfamily)
LSCNEPGTTHNPVAHDTDGCVCISAVKGMVFTGFFDRVIGAVLKRI